MCVGVWWVPHRVFWVELSFINNYKEPQLWLVLLRYSADVASTFPWVVTKSIHDLTTKPHYIYPHYPHIERNAFQRENPSHNPWALEIVIPIILYTILCGFPQLLCLHIQILKRLITRIVITPILECKVRFSSSTSVFSLITYWHVILCLHSSSLLF